MNRDRVLPHPPGRLTRGSVPRPDLDFAAAPSSLTGGAAFAPPPYAPTPPSPFDEAIRFLVNHATNGFSVPDYQEALGMGYNGWLEWQLDYENIDDTTVDNALAGYPTLTMTNPELYAAYPDDPSTIVYELQEAVLLRAIYSRKQLYERMVEFWTDHFNISQLDDLDLWFKTRDDARVVRKNALGSFPDMLKNSAKSAAMLWYLDNYNNIAGSVQENYAREIMELHTLGVDGPYTEADIVEVARCFTGWTFHGVFTGGPFGVFTYQDQLHDQGFKTVLGVNIPAGGGITDGETVLDLLAMHPSTALHLSTKMARWLLGYKPPQKLIDRLVAIYLSTNGSIKPMVREILSLSSVTSLKPAKRIKHKRPYHHLTSVMRAAQVPSTALLNLTVELLKMGQVPYWFPTPDGYPDKILAWGKALLPRWDWSSRLFAYDIPGNQPDLATLKALMDTAPAGFTTDAEKINWVMTGGDADPAHVAEVQTFINSQNTTPNVVLREAFALMASSPSYQYY
jgi:uncharacterized protein (DUF1800 family)